MIVADERRRHEETWLLLPWLANGRLSATEREQAEDHVRHCSECEQELQIQHRLCGALTEPDRVIYAPGPSLRKLMDRINSSDSAASGDAAPENDRGKLEEDPPPTRSPLRSGRSVSGRLGHVSLWRPPGLAWAASFLLLFGATALLTTVYRWSEPLYRTHTDTKTAAPNILHIAFDRSLTVGEVEELLQASDAHVVEGPDSTGIFGVTPAAIAPGRTSAVASSQQMQALSRRLRSDPRVRWVEPIAGDEGAADRHSPNGRQAPAAQEP